MFKLFTSTKSQKYTSHDVASDIQKRAMANAISGQAALSEKNPLLSQKPVAPQNELQTNRAILAKIDAILDQVTEIENEKVDALRMLYVALELGSDQKLVDFLKKGDKSAANKKAHAKKKRLEQKLK